MICYKLVFKISFIFSYFYLLPLNKLWCFYLTALNKCCILASEINKKRNAKGSI